MNNIYKVIWSKAKNCYVVASEIARSHTKSASGSEKIGGVTRRSLLASLMALSLLCGGLGVARASLDIEVVNQSGEPGAVTIYTKEGVDKALETKAEASDVSSNKKDIDNLKKAVGDLDSGLTQKVVDQKTAIDVNTASITTNRDNINTLNGKLNDLTATVHNKVDESVVEAALNDKANTDLSNLTADGITKIKDTMSADMEKKANKATTLAGYEITDAYTKEKTDELLNTKANAADVYTRGNIDTKLADVYSKTEVDDKITDEENARNIAIQTAISGEAENRKNAIDAAIAKEVAGRNQAIKIEVDKEANARETAIANAKNDLQTKITEEKTAREATDTALDTRLTTAEGKITANETAIDKLKTKDTELEGKINTLDASSVKYDNATVKDKITLGLGGAGGTTITNLKDADLSDSSTDAVTGKQLNKTNKDLKTEAQTREDMDKLLSNRADALEKNTGGITRNDAKDETYIEKNVTVDNQGNIEAQGKVTANGVDAGAGDITTKGAVNAGSLNVTDASKLKGDVTMDKTLKVTGDTSLKKTDVDGALTVTGESSLKNTTVGGTLGVTGATTLNDKLTAKGEATFGDDVTVKGTTNLKDTTVKGDLNVTGTITTDTMVFGVKPTNYTEIDQGKVTSKNSYINRAGQSITSSSTFDVEKNEVGFVNNATGEQSYHKQTSDVIMDNVKDGKNSNNRTQTKTETKNIITDENRNSSTTSQTASENKTYLKDKDGKNTNSTIDTAKGYDKTIKGENGKTSTTQDELNITNTAKDGTITNDANHIVNKANTMDTTVTGKATESYGELETTVTGNQTTTVTGDISNKAKSITNEANETLTDKVGENTRVTTSTSITDTVGTANRKIEDGKIIDTANDSTVTTENGKGTTFAKTGSTAFSTEAGAPTDTNIAGNHITTGRVDANELGVSDKDGDNTANLTVQAGEDGGVKASASKGTTKGSLDVTAEEVGSTVTDGIGKSSTFKQRIDAIMGNVKTDAGESEVTQEGNKITSKVGLGEATNSRVTQEKGSLEAAVTDGTNTNVSYDVANASAKVLSGGTKENKLQDNLDSSEKTITYGTYKTSTLQSALDITHTAKDGTITHDAKDIVNNASNSITDKVGDHTRVLDGEGITDTVGGSTFKQRIDKIMMESKDVSIKAEETLTNEAKVITNKASEVINNEAVNINNTATGTINSKASEIKNQADKLISNKVGENTWENMEDGKITTSIKDGTKSTVTIQNADGLQTGVTNGTSTNASATTATSSAQTIASGGKANSVITTIDGTQFVNSEAATPVTGASGAGTAVNTTIKGNTITTGKVTMDYADVMKDLGVRGNANINGKTTTGSLEVTGTSTLKGDVTMESNATVKKDLTVEGTTTTKTLKVTENATIGGTLDVAKKATFQDSVDIAKDLSVGGDVTAKSYKVGDKTYISADGINANDQKITNVADGSISEGSKDAVNGGQLYGVKRDLEHQVDKVGANAAAMANLHPMEFDPSSKWNIAAAMGNYGSETATAIGAFYRPNEDVMVNFSTAFGTGENMVGGGVSVRLGKGSNKLSRQESNALKAQVNDLTARMDALLSVLNPNMSKDFPDVPENHWAYEAVSRLAGNDIVQGYPDGEFHGDRTMTRYEMAEIIYNALSRGAEAERELVEEFKPELQAMAASEKATAERAQG